MTRRLEEHELSRALNEALPPFSSALIADVADAFRDLQADRNQLNSSKLALAAVEQFLMSYSRYAAVAAKRRADRVIRAHDEYESAIKELLAAESECDRSLAELGRLKTEMQRFSVEEHALQTQISAFQHTSHLKDGQGLEQALREASDKRKYANNAAAELAEASGIRKTCTDEHLRLRTLHEQRQVRLVSATDAAADAAVLAALDDVHREYCASIDLRKADELSVKELQEKIADAIDKQIERIEHVGNLNERVTVTRAEFQRACSERDQMTGLLDDARERLNTTRAEHQNCITAFLGAASDWTAGLTELPLPFDESFLRSVSEWCDRPNGPNPFAVASHKAVEELTFTFAETRAHLKQLEKNHTAEVSRLEGEYESLIASEHAPDAESESGRDRLERMQATISEAQAKLDSVIDAIGDLNRREVILRSEAQAVPSEDEVRAAYDYSVAISRHVVGLRSRLAEAEQAVSQKQSQLDQAIENCNRTAEDLRIGRWVDELNRLKDGIAEYRLALSSLWPAVEACHEAETATEWAWTLVEQSSAREMRLKETANDFERRAVASEIVRDAASKSAASGFSEILGRVDRARERLEALHNEEQTTRRRYHDMEVAVTRVDERLRNRTAVLNGDSDRRDAAVVSLRSFAATGLLKLLVPELAVGDPLTWSTARAVEVAFELASRLRSIDAGDGAWENLQKSVPVQFTTLMQALSAQGCQSAAFFKDDLFVATAVFSGQDRAMDDYRQILAEDVAARQMLLDARTREILEDHLIGKVSGHLRTLLHAAEEQVRQMNIELESRPTSTGMKLRFVWRPAEGGPSGIAEARRRLMEPNEVWSPAERHKLGVFLQQQIEAVFSDNEGTSWQESLAEALDYRKWHWFAVERFQDDAWKPLTHRTYGTGSGGEKAVTLTLPYFAAAAAFYRTADVTAPRLILLDEAFVGIDADMRAKCMGLIHNFDLDFIMTSEREWGCYQTLPGVAIYQLSTRPGIDAIGLTRWVWNGRGRILMNTLQTESDETSEPPELVTEPPQTLRAASADAGVGNPRLR